MLSSNSKVFIRLSWSLEQRTSYYYNSVVIKYGFMVEYSIVDVWFHNFSIHIRISILNCFPPIQIICSCSSILFITAARYSARVIRTFLLGFPENARPDFSVLLFKVLVVSFVVSLFKCSVGLLRCCLHLGCIGLIPF